MFDDQPSEELPDSTPVTRPALPAKKQALPTPTPIAKQEQPVVWVAKTYRIRESYVKAVKNIAYWQRRTIQDIIDTGLTLYLKTIPENDKKDR